MLLVISVHLHVPVCARVYTCVFVRVRLSFCLGNMRVRPRACRRRRRAGSAATHVALVRRRYEARDQELHFACPHHSTRIGVNALWLAACVHRGQQRTLVQHQRTRLALGFVAHFEPLLKLLLCPRLLRAYSPHGRRELDCARHPYKKGVDFVGGRLLKGKGQPRNRLTA